MKRSDDRILSTHVGSLPRSPEMMAALQAHSKGAPLDPAFVLAAIRTSVRQQAEIGLDVVTDGELARPSFVTYIQERLSGFETSERAAANNQSVWLDSKEARSFPDFYRGTPPGAVARKICTGPITYTGHTQIQADIATLKTALQGVAVEEAFMPAISPTNVAALQINEYYPSEEEFNLAIADAMNQEYRAIVEAGLVLQVDDPHLITHYVKDGDISLADARKWATRRADYLNHALRGISADRVRFHTCAGINIGPRVHDMQMKDIVDVMLRVNAGAYSFEFGNPRHEHEWRLWATAGLPDDKIVIPGFISNSTVLVEHPELVADRIERFAGVVGRERVMAGADCGFASIAGNQDFPDSIIWAKLSALTQGARIASERLWGKRRAA